MASLYKLLRSHHQVRAGLRVAITEIERLHGSHDSPQLRLLRHVLAEGRAVAATIEEPPISGDDYELTEKAWAEANVAGLRAPGTAPLMQGGEGS